VWNGGDLVHSWLGARQWNSVDPVPRLLPRGDQLIDRCFGLGRRAGSGQAFPRPVSNHRVSIFDTVCEILDVADPWQHEDALRAYASNRGVDVRGMDVGALMLAVAENALEGTLV
jgi:hypothetical protein